MMEKRMKRPAMPAKTASQMRTVGEGRFEGSEMDWDETGMFGCPVREGVGVVEREMTSLNVER
jgi:hypothetical protein